MNSYNKITMKVKSAIIYYLAGLALLLIANVGFAKTIVINPNTVIASSKTYNDVTLDLSHGSFIIRNDATLTISNSIINGTLSKEIPLLISIENGKLSLDNNHVNIKTLNLPEHPQTQSLQYVMQVGRGSVNLNQNKFTIDQSYTAGLLITTSTIPTTGMKITNNRFEKFHGVLYLISSDNSLIENNTFKQNSYGHIVLVGYRSKIIQNSIYFSGNFRLGNSIDIIDSSNVVVNKNLLFTPTCHGIYVLNSSNMVISNNRISGGITYAMNILSYPETMKEDDKYLLNFRNNHYKPNTSSKNISIYNNYMSQNRYGIAVNDTSDISINNNIFIQRFADNDSRKFWTNNSILLQNVKNLSWTNNLYKEAYSQDNSDNNSKSSKFVNFPQTGGVDLQ